MDRKRPKGAVRARFISYLEQFVTEDRQERLKEVLQNRTRQLTVVLEDIYQSHNASAVLRSSDGFGVQDVHIIENSHSYSVDSAVTIGADKWLTVEQYRDPSLDNTELCFRKLKNQGYTLYAASPHDNDRYIHELEADHKIALVFGAELDGLSDRAMALADGYVKVPMHGFSESYNISVSAAICLSWLSHSLRSQTWDWRLADEEQNDLYLQWLLKSVRNRHLHEKQFWAQEEV